MIYCIIVGLWIIKNTIQTTSFIAFLIVDIVRVNILGYGEVDVLRVDIMEVDVMRPNIPNIHLLVLDVNTIVIKSIKKKENIVPSLCMAPAWWLDAAFVSNSLYMKLSMYNILFILIS